MKKVLFISSLYFPHAGGIETMIREMARDYKSKGIEVAVLAKRWPLDLESRAIYESVDIFRMLSARTNEEFGKAFSFIKENEESLKADIIHVIGMRRPMPMVAMFLGRRWGVPVICTVAGGDIPDSTDPYPGSVWKESEATVYDAMERCDAVTCVSTAIARDFMRFFPGIRKDEPKVLYAGIDLDFIKDISMKKAFDSYIFSLRRLDPTKGIHILIQAFKTICDRYPKLQLVIAGDGPEAQNLKDLAASLGISEKVHFIGTVSLADGIAFLKGAEMTVVPSISEAGGLINVEAQAASCPVVASDVGGIPEYISHGDGGLLFKSGDADDLAEKMARIIDDEKLKQKLVGAGLRYSKRFDWKVIAPSYLSLYEECIERYAASDPQRDDFEENILWSKLWKQFDIMTIC